MFKLTFTHSLRKNLIRNVIGGVMNISQGSVKRRYTLFFEDILALYAREIEAAGYGSRLQGMDQKWMNLVLNKHRGGLLSTLPPTIFVNDVLCPLWVQLGLMDDFVLTKKDELIRINTKNEGVTRIIGKNRGMVGFHMGVCNVAFDADVQHVSSAQTKSSCEYLYRIGSHPFHVPSKAPQEYDELNYLPDQRNVKGVNLQEALNKKLIVLRGNNLYFRGKFLCPIENTIFHIIGNEGICLEKVTSISLGYFRGCVDKNTSDEKKLLFLKILLQLMGWGVIKIIYDNRGMNLEISSPPHGLQVEKDNWFFIENVVLGYLHMIDGDLRVTDRWGEGNRITIRYSH